MKLDEHLHVGLFHQEIAFFHAATLLYRTCQLLLVHEIVRFGIAKVGFCGYFASYVGDHRRR